MKVYVVIQVDMYGDLIRVIGVAANDDIAQEIIDETGKMTELDCPWEMPVYFTVREFDLEQ